MLVTVSLMLLVLSNPLVLANPQRLRKLQRMDGMDRAQQLVHRSRFVARSCFSFRENVQTDHRDVTTITIPVNQLNTCLLFCFVLLLHCAKCRQIDPYPIILVTATVRHLHVLLCYKTYVHTTSRVLESAGLSCLPPELRRDTSSR